MQEMKKEKDSNHNDSQWMTLVEASAYSRLGIKAIRNFIYDGMLPSYKPRRYRLVKRHELDKFIEKSETKIPEKGTL